MTVKTAADQYSIRYTAYALDIPRMALYSLWMTDMAVVTIRVEPELKQRGEQLAAARDETLSQVLRRALRVYVGMHGRDDALVAAADEGVPLKAVRGGLIHVGDISEPPSEPVVESRSRKRRVAAQKGEAVPDLSGESEAPVKGGKCSKHGLANCMKTTMCAVETGQL